MIAGGPLPAQPQFLASLGLAGVVGGTGQNGISIELEQSDTSDVDPNEYFQIFQSPDEGASIRMTKGIDFDVSNSVSVRGEEGGDLFVFISDLSQQLNMTGDKYSSCE